MININNCANMPHDTNTLSAGLRHAAQAHTNSQPPLNCSNTADTVTMNWMRQGSDLVHQNTAAGQWPCAPEHCAEAVTLCTRTLQGACEYSKSFFFSGNLRWNCAAPGNHIHVTCAHYVLWASWPPISITPNTASIRPPWSSMEKV